jgi:hypothetical protein
MIDTKRVPRRRLRLETIGDAMEELDRIAQAERNGTLTAHGNWTPGQIMAHVAAWIEYGWGGYPIKPPPFFVRWIMRLMLKRYLRNGMPTGVTIPGVASGTTGADQIDTRDAIERLRAAFARLASGDAVQFDSPAFGPMGNADRVQLQLRHAELHLSFLSLENKSVA